MRDFSEATLCLILVVAVFILGLFIGFSTTTKTVNEEVLRQCKAGEFYFFDGVGIHCPTMQDNRKEQK